MQIELDERATGDPTLRGRLIDAPGGEIDVALEVTIATPFGTRLERRVAVGTTDAMFELPWPTWPLSSNGDVVSMQWNVVARPETGDAAVLPIDVGADSITIESIANDDLAAPPAPLDWRVPTVAAIAAVVGLVGVGVGIATDRTWLWVLAGFLVFFAAIPLGASLTSARQRSVLGHVTCSIEPRHDALECLVITHPPDEVLEADVTATLLIVQMASRFDADRGPTEFEEVVVEHTIALAPLRRNEWSGALPLHVVRGAPLSHHWRDGAAASAVSWVVRIRIVAPHTPHFDRVLPLLALPTGLDPALRPQYVEVPKAAQR